MAEIHYYYSTDKKDIELDMPFQVNITFYFSNIGSKIDGEIQIDAICYLYFCHNEILHLSLWLFSKHFNQTLHIASLGKWDSNLFK